MTRTTLTSRHKPRPISDIHTKIEDNVGDQLQTNTTPTVLSSHISLHCNNMAHSKGHICQCLGRLRLLRRDSPLTITGDRCRTGVEFVDSVLNLAHGLSQHDIRPGDVIAIAALNSDLYLEWLLAITYVGGIVAPLNYRWSFEEARSAMDVVRPVMLVVDESCSSWAPALQNNRQRCNVPLPRLYVLAGESSCLSNLGASENRTTMDSIIRPSHGADVVDLKWAPRGVALICFTSGTTGRPKGVAISHEALIAQSLTKIAIVGYGEDDVYLHTAPLCHIGGISSCISMLMAGGCHVFIPKFDANIAFQAITQHCVTSFITVPAIMADLISVGRKQNNTNIGRMVEKILNGGGRLSDALIDCATHTFPRAKIISAYGMTETTSSLTFKVIRDPTMLSSQMIHLNNSKPKPDLVQQQNRGVCVGKPAPHVELCIYGNCENSRSPLIGSILTRGMHVMVRYWDCTNASNLDSSDHGWFDTGDVGWLDDNGDLWLIGRNKDRIKSGGENIYPEEVENVLSQHPGVLNAFVVGIPDLRLAEKVVAYVTTRNDWKWIDQGTCHSPETKELSDEILRSYCRQRNLSGFKIPKMFILWSKPWPLTTTGKVKREDLRKDAFSYLKLLHSKL